MTRARHNVELIERKLSGLDFRFHRKSLSSLKTPVGVPTKNTLELLDSFEQRIKGPLPMSLRSWYERIDGVCLCGYHPWIAPQGQGGVFRAPQYREALCVQSIVDAVEYSESFNSNDDIDHQDVFPDAFEFVFWNEREGWEEWTMDLPNGAADASIDGLEKTFVEHLRNVFEWGGFPGWEGDPFAPTKELNYLRDGLLPI
jgi:hypothetical protein